LIDGKWFLVWLSLGAGLAFLAQCVVPHLVNALFTLSRPQRSLSRNPKAPGQRNLLGRWATRLCGSNRRW